MAQSTNIETQDGFSVTRDKGITAKNESQLIIIIFAIVLSGMWLINPSIALNGLAYTVIFGLLAISLNYQTGHTGIINFGVVGFFAVGAYTSAILSLMLYPWWISLTGAMVVASLFTLVISIPTLKLREDYFAIFTITFGEIIRIIFQAEEWIVFPPSNQGFFGGTKGLITSGSTFGTPISNIINDVGGLFGPTVRTATDIIRDGLLSIGVPEIFTLNLDIPYWYHISVDLAFANFFHLTDQNSRMIAFVFICVVLLLAIYWFFERIYNSPLGRVNKAIREDDLAVESLGINVYKQRVLAMSIGNLSAGLAGGLYAFFLGSVHPVQFFPIVTFFVWSILVVGGYANNRGIMLGALIYGASIPLLVQLNDDISNLFGSFMNPIVPAITSGLVDESGIDLSTLLISGINISFIMSMLVLSILILYFFFYEKNNKKQFKATILFSLILIITYVPIVLNDLFKFLEVNLDFIELLILNVDYLSYFILVVLLGIVFSVYYYEIKRQKRLYFTSIFSLLFCLSVFPIILTNIIILPLPDFGFFQRIEAITYVSLDVFFRRLSPFLARDMALGIVLILFILFKPSGILKERKIKTVDSFVQYEKYLALKKDNNNANSIDEIFQKPVEDLPDTLLKTNQLSKSFGGISALDDVSIAVKRGVLLGIIGPNGSGKSTLYNVVTGILDQDKNKEGEISFVNKEISTDSTHKRVQEGLGRTFQQARLFKELTVLENLLVSPKNQKGGKYLNSIRRNWVPEEEELHVLAFKILDFLNILHIWNHKARNISGGQQKLVSLGRALMGESKLILLDEPVAGVNPTLAKRIFEKIQYLQQSRHQNFVIIEHNMDVQLSFCDYIFVFDKGQIVAEGTPSDIKNNKNVIAAYLGH